MAYSIRRATEADIPLIHQMAWQVFPQTYRGIITDGQIDYMMDWMYSEASLQRQMAEGHVYLLGMDGDEAVGYVSIERQGPDLFHLQKIYVLPTCQGHGAGRFLFESAVGYVKSIHPTPCTLELNVNRTNPALGFYRQMGMHVSRQGDFDIGNGFYMNDYIMAMEVAL